MPPKEQKSTATATKPGGSSDSDDTSNDYDTCDAATNPKEDNPQSHTRNRCVTAAEEVAEVAEVAEVGGSGDEDIANPIFDVKETPTLEVAATLAAARAATGLSVEDESKLMQESNKIVDKLAAIDGPAGLDDMSRDEAASINIYTQDSPVYKVLNRMLLKGDRDPLKQWFPYLKLLLTALHKLPSCPGTYFRGVSADIASQYTKGTKMVWWPFSSSTATIEALGAFMEPGEPRVLFSLEVQRVVDISKFSSFAEDEVADGVGEDERLLIAGIPLEVKSIIALPDNITMVQMTEDLDRPPLIPGFTLKPPPPAEVPASDRPPVDILVIVDYPTNGGGGGGAIEPAKYIAPFQALQAALNARFVGTQARIRFHTPRSIVVDDGDLLKERIPCVCWIAIGEEASTVEDLTFATSLWKARGGRCDFAIVLMKHGAENRSRALLENECADRTLWVSADYTDTPIANGFLADRKSSAAAIPEVLYAALSGTAFNNERTAHKCCSNVLELAKNRGVDAGIKIIESCTEIPQVMKGDELPVDGVGISLSSADSDPAELTSNLVGAPKHSSVDLNQWSQVCDLLRTLDKGRSGLHVMAVTGGTDAERKSVAWTAVQSYIAVAGRFKLVVYRNADLPESSRENPETFDLPFDTHGGQDVLVWMNSESELPLEALREAIDAFVEDDGMPLPWTFILTSQSDFDDIEDEFADVTDEISLQEAIGTSVNESSEDLIRIVPADPTLKVLSILEVLNAAELLNLLVAALPQIASESLSDRGARDYIDQLLVGDNNSVVVRGMAPNTRFLFELRNDLIDGSLDERINKLVRDFVADGSDLGGQVWTLDKSAFANIYPKILSQMDQLSPHQREKLQECEASRRVHVTGPAGCGKTFIALHMVVDLIEAAGSTSKSISQESPILFVGKNEALCRFFVNWILLRLRKKKKTKAAKVAMSDYVRVLHTSPFEDQVFALDFGSGGKMDFVKAKVSSNHSLVIVDEAHHIFAAGAGPSADDAAKVTELCMTAGRSLLLSDISQSGAAGAVVFPPDHKDVVLKEVVRNSSRIVTASLPFCRSVDLDDVTCIHGVRGPPLEPFMFNHCGGDGIARYTKYVEGIIHGLKHMNDTFPGVEIHDNLVILVPDLKFKDELQRRLTLAINEQIPAPGMSIVGAVDGAFAERKRREREPSRIVLDTLESFDGMERLFVFAVGLDSVKTTEGCCGIYRAITRAHMFVCVVQEHLKGGWLEFTAAIQSDGHVDFDEAKERERVARENLIVIESNASKENADQNTSSNNGNITVAGEVKVDLFDRTADGLNDANPIQGIESPKINLASKDDRVDEEAPSLVLTSNVWGTNLNSKAFSGTISNLSFNPMNPNTLQDKWTVIASFVVVREHASLSSTEVHRLAHGDEVYVVGQETLADADRTERLQISTSSGTIGWVTRHLAGHWMLVPVMNPIPPQGGKFVCKIELGTPALGLADLMGHTTMSIMQLINAHGGDGVRAIKQEIADHGSDDDKMNLRCLLDGTYVNPPHEDGTDPTPLEIAARSQTIETLMTMHQVRIAKLEAAHVLALRLYTTTSHKSINAPLRDTGSTHPLAATTYYINEGLNKLRRVEASSPDANTPKTFWRGLKNREIDSEFFCKGGGCEFGCMSTSAFKNVAVEFARSTVPFLFQIETKDFMQRGADISFLSVYPDEQGMLVYPPLMFLRSLRTAPTIEKIDGYHVQIVVVEPHFPYW